MLVLSRKIGEVITIGNSVTVTVLSYDRGIVRLGIDAPKNISVHRKEVYDKIIELNKLSARTQLVELKKALNSVGINYKSNEKDILSDSSYTINKNE